ncbi:hypothetical protein JCM19298_1576 [Nonlabens ulvanivorans]|nr:hypothetical protein [Nonlabens ulvanivorans]GAK95247.1 hypothetical protein JCM19298_1576 [Nonlabens ulvanivorans]
MIIHKISNFTTIKQQTKGLRVPAKTPHSPYTFAIGSNLMNHLTSIKNLIQDYQKSVDEVVAIFQKRYGVENLLDGWHSGLYEQTGKLKEYGIKFYAFHGIGLSTHFEDKLVDFDFAFFPEPKWNGFDLWRLKSFVKNQPEKYEEFLDDKKLELDFASLIKSGAIKKPKLDFSTTLYFWTNELPQNLIDKKKSWWRR